MENLKRDKRLEMRVTEEELSKIYQNMHETNIRNLSAYIRKMALSGYIVQIDFSEIREFIRLLANATNNINQIAKVANKSKSVSVEDIKILQRESAEMLARTREILMKFENI